MKIVPLDPPVTRQSLRSGDVASGTTDSSPDFDLVNDKANYEVVCDGAIGEDLGDRSVDRHASKFATENPAAAARFVEAGYRRQRVIMKDREQAVHTCSSSTRTSASTATRPRRATRSAFATTRRSTRPLADMRSGATEKALTETAQVFVAGGAYDKVPDLDQAR